MYKRNDLLMQGNFLKNKCVLVDFAKTIKINVKFLTKKKKTYSPFTHMVCKLAKSFAIYSHVLSF